LQLVSLLSNSYINHTFYILPYTGLMEHKVIATNVVFLLTNLLTFMVLLAVLSATSGIIIHTLFMHKYVIMHINYYATVIRPSLHCSDYVDT